MRALSKTTLTRAEAMEPYGAGGRARHFLKFSRQSAI